MWLVFAEEQIGQNIFLPRQYFSSDFFLQTEDNLSVNFTSVRWIEMCERELDSNLDVSKWSDLIRYRFNYCNIYVMKTINVVFNYIKNRVFKK